MSKSEKRERQRQNRAVAREERVAAEKKRRTRRSVGIFVAFLIPVVVIFVVLRLTGGSDDPEPRADDRRTTTTTGATATTTGATAATTVPTRGPLPAPGAVSIDPTKSYTAVIETTEGTIEIALDARNAPVSVNNFVYLTRAGWYDGLRFNRASRNFVIQTGSSNNTTAGGGPGYTVPAELPTSAYEVGSVAWAKSGAEPAGTAGSQFFIGTGPQVVSLPKDYGYIGKVTKGLDVAQKIMGFAPASGDGPLTTPVTMTKVTITES